MYSIKVVLAAEIAPDWQSRAIMYFEGRPYSHAMIFFEDTDGKEKIFHSILKGVRIEDDMSYMKSHKIIRMYEVPMKISREEFCMYIRGREGREYSESQFVNILLNKMGIKWVPFRNANEASVCSEEVAAAARFADLNIPEFDLDIITPAQIDDFLEAQSKVKRLK